MWHWDRTQPKDVHKDLHRLRRLTTLWGGRSRVKWLRKGASNRATNITFFKCDVGFSSTLTADKKHVWVLVPVQTVAFAELLEKIHLIIPESKKLTKIDVEGSEYEVPEQLLEKQLLCKTRIDTMSSEWHRSKLMNEYKVKFDRKTKQKYRHIEQRLGKGDSCEGEPTKVIGLDDESFISDGQPLPDE